MRIEQSNQNRKMILSIMNRKMSEFKKPLLDINKTNLLNGLILAINMVDRSSGSKLIFNATKGISIIQCREITKAIWSERNSFDYV